MSVETTTIATQSSTTTTTTTTSNTTTTTTTTTGGGNKLSVQTTPSLNLHLDCCKNWRLKNVLKGQERIYRLAMHLVFEKWHRREITLQVRG